MSVAVETRDRATVVRIEGPVRMIMPVSADLRDELAQAASQVTSHCVLDFSALETIDSAGLSAIIAFRRALQGAGRDLTIVGLRTSVRMLFELTRLHDVFTIRDDLDAALAAIA